MFQGHTVVAVVAIGKNRELGNADKLLWHIPEDLKRFKDLTRGHPIIMGRKTFESIVGYIKKPLPERTNIVVTRDLTYTESLQKRSLEGVRVADSLEHALEIAAQSPGSEEIHIGGGAQMYEQALPYLDTLHLTLVDDVQSADTFFPSYEHFFREVFREDHQSNGLKYSWVDFERS